MPKNLTRAAIDDWLEERDESVLLADGLDAAFLGVVCRCGQKPVAIYDTNKCIAILMKHGMSYEEARDYFEFNTLGAWVGDQTPGYLERI